MCGIGGIVGPWAAHERAGDVTREMARLQAHRGPDGEGFAAGPGFRFCHRRLAVIDLETGAQPMETPDGAVTIVFNGEIYNYVELRQQLIRQGERFRTSSDTEVLLKLYQRHGKTCVDHLNGMFAFAVFDRRNNCFFAARDHFGVKPFYFASLPDGSLVFASEIKAILAHPQIDVDMDGESLNHYLTFQFCLGDATLFKGVKKLDPGHRLVWSGPNDLYIERYWNVDYTIDDTHDEAHLASRVHSLLQASVNRQLRSDVPVGAYLSGGLDSSTVVALAAEGYGNGFTCFSGRFAEGERYDESRYARIMAEYKGAAYLETVPTAEDFMESLPRLIYHMDEPAAGPGLFPQYMVSRLAADHVKVILGGQGGDEIFGGYARYLVAYLEQSLKGGILETSEEGRHIVTLESIIPNLPILRQYVPQLKHFWKEGVFESMEKRYFRLVDRSPDLDAYIAPAVLEQYDGEAVFAAFAEIFNRPDTKSYVNKMTRFDQETLLPALLHVEDRVSMAVSLESRVPLLDPELVQLVASMPPAMKFKGGRTKHILREAMGPFLPREIMKRKDKMGFPVPLGEWRQGPLRDFVGDILLSKRCRERGLFNHDGLKNLVDSEGRYGRQLWGAICLELWCRAFLDGEGGA